MTSAPARPTPRTQLAGVETADTQREREGKLQAADRGTAPPGRAMFRLRYGELLYSFIIILSSSYHPSCHLSNLVATGVLVIFYLYI